MEVRASSNAEAGAKWHVQGQCCFRLLFLHSLVFSNRHFLFAVSLSNDFFLVRIPLIVAYSSSQFSIQLQNSDSAPNCIIQPRASLAEATPTLDGTAKKFVEFRRSHTYRPPLSVSSPIPRLPSGYSPSIVEAIDSAVYRFVVNTTPC